MRLADVLYHNKERVHRGVRNTQVVKTFTLERRTGLSGLHNSYVFGPVMSRRLGVSLGINVLPRTRKLCNFECPYCGALFPTLQKIEADYKGKVNVVYYQFPLVSIHPHAQKAAEASLCANEQGKFWQLHDAMFNDQQNLGVDDLKKKASLLSLDTAAFNSCLDNDKFFADIRSDVAEGSNNGISGTPAMFINGRLLVGNQPYADIKKIIEDELRRTASK